MQRAALLGSIAKLSRQHSDYSLTKVCPRRVRSRIQVGQGPARYLVQGVLRRDDEDAQVFFITLLTPGYIRKVLGYSVEVGKAKMYHHPDIIEYTDPAEGETQACRLMEPLEDLEVYAETLNPVNEREAYACILDHSPVADIPNAWEPILADAPVLLRYDADRVVVNYEMLTDSGRLLTALDLNLSRLWQYLGSQQWFYGESDRLAEYHYRGS